MLIPKIKTFKLGNDTVKLETGRIARQADGAVLVSINNDVTVLVTVVASKKANEGQDFFPLSVHYIEKSYSSGKIPGSFLKREGRPSDAETLTSRLIDRPLRPLFPEGFFNEVQILCTVLSSNKKTDPDIASLIGASAALEISGIPFNGPIGAVRVGFNKEFGYILNPAYKDLKKSDLDMVVAGTDKAVLMVESEAQELTEDLMLGAILFAHQEMQSIITNIKEFAQEVNKDKWDWKKPDENDELVHAMKSLFWNDIFNAYQITVKQDRYKALDDIRLKVLEYCASRELNEKEVLDIFENLQYRLVRDNILSGKPRIDGRDIHTVRPLHIEVNVLDKVHGSALFTRGETQAIVVTTLGSQKDEQLLEDLSGERKDPFIFHYNFPPYSVGECGRIGSVGRREIGHGRLARRGISPMMPKHKDFPYTVRVVSEITESNGSSSMASVCGASLSLMDAGVPLKAPVAGVAMGLVLEGEKFAVLTDILGDEDHLGDMDFKVAGTSNGITALQMDIKIEGINEEIMEVALKSALKARLYILSQMNEVLANYRTELNENAPTIITMKINPEKIKDVIGKGGAMIRSICEEAGASVDIDDSGQIKIFGETKQAALNAKIMVEKVTLEAEVGKVYVGKVARITDFGAFVNILPNIDGLLHVSMIKNERVEKVTDVLSHDQVIKVKVLDIDSKGRIKLSMKDIEQD